MHECVLACMHVCLHLCACVCVCWCASVGYYKLLVAKIMTDAHRSAYSQCLSFLLSVKIMHSQKHDWLSISLMEDRETTCNKDEAVRIVGCDVFTDNKKEEREGWGLGNDSQWMDAQHWSLSFPWSFPRALSLLILKRNNLFSVDFIFIWVSSFLFLFHLPLLVSERGAIKCIALLT